MERLLKSFEKYVLPVAGNLAKMNWIVALRDAFISLLPVTITGSMAILIDSLIDVTRTRLKWNQFANILNPIVTIDNIIWNATFALFSVYFAFLWGYHLAKAFDVDPIAGAIVSLASFFMSINNSLKYKVAGTIVDLKKIIDINQFSTSGLFTAIIFGFLGTGIFILCCKARLTLKLDTNMSDAEWQILTSLIPAMIAIFSIGIINYIFQTITGTYFGNWLLNSIQVPLVKMGQGFGVVILITFLVQIFWFFGINGISILTPVIDSLWLTPQNSNVSAVYTGHAIPYSWVRGSFNVFAWFGGTGGTLMLIVAILIFSKRKDYRIIAKMGLAPGVFNINEPILFGIPIVFNPIFIVPFIVGPIVNVSLAYWITKLGWVNPVQVFVPNVMPPIIGPFLACNYDWRAIVLEIVNMLISFAIWSPFVIASNKLSSNDHDRGFRMNQF